MWKFPEYPNCLKKNLPNYELTPGSDAVVPLFSGNIDEISEMLDAMD